MQGLPVPWRELAVLAAPSNPCPKSSKVPMVLGDVEGHLGDRNALLCIARAAQRDQFRRRIDDATME